MVPQRQINFHVSTGNSDAVLLNTLEIAFSCYCGRKFNTGSIYYIHLHSISVNFLGTRAYCFYCAVIPEIQIAQNSSNHRREHLSGFSFTLWIALMAQSPRWPSFFYARPSRGPPSLSDGKSEVQRGNEYLLGLNACILHRCNIFTIHQLGILNVYYQKIKKFNGT